MEPPPAVSPTQVLSSRDFRFYLAARFLATTAIQMLGTAVAFQVYALTKRSLDLGLLGLSQFLPIAVFSLIAGHVADRVDRRAVLFVADVVFALCAIALWWMSKLESPAVWAIFAVFFVIGVARAFYGPAGSSLLPSLVPREHVSSAVAWQSASWQMASIGGPAMGGGLYAMTSSPTIVYIVSTIGFVIGAFLLAGIRARPAPLSGVAGKGGITLSTLLAGVRYIRRHQILLGSITLDFFAVFLGGATALLPVFATDILHVGAGGLGALRAAPAIGAGITAGFLAIRPLGSRAGPKMLWGVAVFGIATIVFGLSRNFMLSLLALGILGAADMVSAVVRGTLTQTATPDSVRGRVSAVNLIFIGASNELGEFESGTLAAWIGAVPCVIVGGAGTLVVVAAWTWLFPVLRKIERVEDVAPVSER
jgi:MFS family permease